jgi:hypothetical protein
MTEISCALLDHAGKLRLEILVPTSVSDQSLMAAIMSDLFKRMGVRPGVAYISMFLAIRVAS